MTVRKYTSSWINIFHQSTHIWWIWSNGCFDCLFDCFRNGSFETLTFGPNATVVDFSTDDQISPKQLLNSIVVTKTQLPIPHVLAIVGILGLPSSRYRGS